MRLLRFGLVALLLVIGGAVWAQAPSPPSTAEDAKAAQLLGDGLRAMQAKKPAEAIVYVDKAIASYEERYRDKAVKYYSARDSTEMLYYLLDAAGANKGSAAVASGNWGYAHYLKGYALLDLGRSAEAKAQLLRAVALSPQNSQFLSELGHVYQLEKNWNSALETFQRAENAARAISGPMEPHAVPLDLKCAHRRSWFQRAHSVRLIPAELNVL